MKMNIFVRIALVCLAVNIFNIAPNVNATDQINFEQTISGSIDEPLQIKTYYFSANAKDQLLLRISKTEGDLDPQFKLYSPSGKTIADEYSLSEYIEGYQTLPDNGTYQLLICDKYGNDIGKFSLMICKINNPIQSEQINFEQTISSSIDEPLQVKTYYFSANTKDQLLLRISKTEGDLDPQFKLYSPSGENIADEYSLSEYIEDYRTLPDNGTYQLLICDKYGNDIGKFSLLIYNYSSPSPTSTSTQLVIQKSSETSPEINIEPIDKQKLSNTTVLLSGSASSDNGIKSVTVDGQYAGTEHWELPVDLSLGDGNIEIVATDNDGNTTILTINIFNPEPEPKSYSFLEYLIGGIATIIAAIIIARHSKK